MIEGTWQLVSGEQDGQPVSDSDIQNSKLEITGEQHKVAIGDVSFTGTHSLDQDADPMTIDANDESGPFAGQTTLGIFQIKGDEFKVCFGGPGKPRPTAFTTQDGQATILHVWKRSDA